MRGKSHTGDSWNSWFISRKNLYGLKFFLLLTHLLKSEADFKAETFSGIFYTHVYFLFT
jgi:hypothetical protein